MTSSTRKVMNMILALIVSIGAWIYVVYNYYPMTEVDYLDVPVSFVGEAGLAERGLVVSDASAEGISVRLKQRRIDCGRITSENIVVTADVSDCDAGENSVSLNVVGPEDTSVIYTDTDNVEVDVARAKRDVKEISVVYNGEVAEDEEPIATDLSYLEAEVACSEDRLSKISKVAAVLERENVTGTVRSYTAKLVALDSDGEKMQHVVISPDEISLDACEGFTKEVSLTVPVKKKVDDNYVRTYVAPDKVTIKGPKDLINNIGTVRADEVDIRYIYDNCDLPLSYNLPEGVYIADESLNQVIRISVREKEEEEEETSDTSE